jgi:putative AdoMet-dependent methyltransferase
MTTPYPNWQRNELAQIGTDYTDPAEVARFDARGRQFFDIDTVNRGLVDRLGLTPEHVVLDMGSGTGSFALAAARRCKRVACVDVSRPMLEHARRTAAQAGVGNIEFHHGGFLTYDHTTDPVDVIVSRTVLHHLPDAWKQIALTRLAGMLVHGGRLCLQDVVFTFDPTDYAAVFGGMVADFAARTDTEFAGQLERHLRDEFSTFDWIMEGLLRRAGFRIDQADYTEGLAQYLCTKGRDSLWAS